MRTRHLIAAVAVAPLAAACSSATTGEPPVSLTAPASPTVPASPAAVTKMLPDGYVPLWPFASAGEVAAWQRSHRSGGHSPWHLDAAQTALSFASGYLGLPGIDRVTKPVIGRTEAHIGVGYRAERNADGTAAIVHLFRVGAEEDAPWEVVGTDDTTFTLTTPSYGSKATSPVRVGGRISGVDESIRIRVRGLASDTPLGGFCCLPAGGERFPWTARLTFRNAPPKAVLTIVASTGGHLAEVERFAVTGVRTP
ncbi:hypothetical protein [Actinocorallia longicatena]|uniref:hypothetical protein n=1 Tax=Actinocorallia longicatena TaxID=111803 RepID=UPI0031DA831B